MNAPPKHGTLLLVEDDAVFAGVLARVLTTRGFDVVCTATAAATLSQARTAQPAYAVIDLKLGEDNGLDLLPVLRAALPDLRILLLTGYASIATAVEAIKRGANDYLAKPVDADAVVRALLGDEDARMASDQRVIPTTRLPLRRLEWEHIQRTLLECDGNVSAAARRLGMHRRTLQRKLEKRPVPERPAF